MENIQQGWAGENRGFFSILLEKVGGSQIPYDAAIDSCDPHPHNLPVYPTFIRTDDRRTGFAPHYRVAGSDASDRAAGRTSPS